MKTLVRILNKYKSKSLPLATNEKGELIVISDNKELMLKSDILKPNT